MSTRRWIFIVLAVAFAVYLFGSLSNSGDEQVVKGAIGIGAAQPVEPPDMRQPVRIAESKDGDILVSDYVQGLIYTVNTDLSVSKAFPISGRPLGVAWSKGKIFVGNDTTSWVEVYNRNGKLLHELGAQVVSPTDIAIDDTRDMLFVVDGEEKVVKVFDTKGDFLSVIPKADIVQEVLLNPTGIAVDMARGEVVISDYGDPLNGVPASIKVYDYEGIFRFSIVGDDVQSAYRFSRPQGLAVDSAGNFFLVDSMLGKVLAFNRNTKLGIKTLGSFGTAPGELKLPMDVIIDPDSGDVYVTNFLNRRIEAFRGGGLP